MAITDLTGTTWVIKENINFYDATIAFPDPLSINMKCENILGDNVISRMEDGDTYIQLMSGNTYVQQIIGSDGQGRGRTLEFISGTDITNAELISWLETYTVQQVAPTQSNYLKIYSNDDRTTHYKIFANGICVATIARVNATQEGSELTVLSAPATQNGSEVTLG